jgi:heterotetrameric sarcosine oxidase delta subunit
MITCPNCGPREVTEYKFGGGTEKPPGKESDLTGWRDYLYFWDNRPGIKEEWWYHSFGCSTWFKIKRDTRTNEVIKD